MKQALHIFRKDTRYLWPEILASLAALAMSAAWSPHTWSYTPTAMRWQGLVQLLPVLVFATWALLAARLVQAESLAGDRQWWITRPYEWKNLLAAKALFAVVWIYLPFVVEQAVVLREGGFSPYAYAAGWGMMMAVVSGWVVLPLLATAAVTENFVRMALTACGIVAALVVGYDLVTMPRGGYDSTVPNDHHMWVVAVLMVGTAFVLVLQYATRRTRRSRGLAAGVVLLATCVAATLTATQQSRIDRWYPAAAGAGPMQIAMPVKTKALYIQPLVRVGPSERPGMMYVQVPVDFSGIAEGRAVQVDDVKIAIDDVRTGWHWTAPWWTSRALHILPGTHRGQVEIMLRKEQLKRFVAGSGTMQLTLAVTELQASTDAPAAISPGDDLVVPGFGVCNADELNRFNQLICRSAMGQPPLTRVSATWYPKECSPQERMPNAPLTAATWAGSLQSSSARASLSTVQLVLVNLYPDWHDGYDLYRTVGLPLCPGTVVHFTRYNPIGHARVSVTLPSSYFQMAVPDNWRDER